MTPEMVVLSHLSSTTVPLLAGRHCKHDTASTDHQKDSNKASPNNKGLTMVKKLLSKLLEHFVLGLILSQIEGGVPSL